MADLPIDPVTGRFLLDDSLGAVFIGTILAGILWGITCSQVFHYYTTRPKDPAWIKVMVAATWVFDTIHQTLIYIQLYEYCVTYFGDIVHLFSVPKTTPGDMSFIPLTALVVHAFYTQKIWQLSNRNKLLITPIIVLCLVELGLGIFLVYASASTPFEWEAQLKADRPAGLAHSAVSSVLDGSITAAMIWLLRRNRTEYVQTNSIIGKLTVFVLSTNLLTAALALVIVIVDLVFPKDLFVVPLFYLIVRLYTNSFMAALNMRPYLRQNHRAAFEETLPGSTSGPGAGSGSHIFSTNIFRERLSTSDHTMTHVGSHPTRHGPQHSLNLKAKDEQGMPVFSSFPNGTVMELEEGAAKGSGQGETKTKLTGRWI